LDQYFAADPEMKQPEIPAHAAAPVNEADDWWLDLRSL
jgi:hypothetical protein